MKKHIYIFGNRSYYDSLEKPLVRRGMMPHFISDEEKTKPNYAQSIEGIVAEFENSYEDDFEVMALIGLSRGSVIRGVENVAGAIERITAKYPKLKTAYTFGPSYKAAEIFTHKGHMATLLEQMGLMIPKTISLTLDKKAPKSTVPYPIVIKAPELAGGRGMVLANNDEEYATALGEMKEAGHTDVVVSQYIDGLEVSFAVLRLGNTFLRLPPCYKEGTSLDLKHPDNKVKLTGIATYPTEIYEKIETYMKQSNTHGFLYLEAIARRNAHTYELFFLEGAARISGNSPIEFAALEGFDFYDTLARWIDTGELHISAGQQLCTQFASYIHHGKDDVEKLSQIPWVIEAKLEDMSMLPHATNHSTRIRVSFIAKNYTTLKERCSTLSEIFDNPDFGKHVQSVVESYRQNHADILLNP